MAITKVKPETPQSKEKGFKWTYVSKMVKDFTFTLIDYEEAKKIEKMKSMFINKIKAHEKDIKKNKIIINGLEILNVAIAALTMCALFNWGINGYNFLVNSGGFLIVLFILAVMIFSKSSCYKNINRQKEEIKFYIRKNIRQYIELEIDMEQNIKKSWIEKRQNVYDKLELFSWKEAEEFVKKEKELAESFQKGINFERKRQNESEEQQLMSE